MLLNIHCVPFSWLCDSATRPWHGPLARYAKLRVAHAPGMSVTFSPSPHVSDPNMHHGMCVTHVPWCMPGSLISGFLWSRWRGNPSRHSWRMRNAQFYVSGKRSMIPTSRLIHVSRIMVLRIRLIFPYGHICWPIKCTHITEVVLEG